MNESKLDQLLTHRREAQQNIVNVNEPLVQLVVFALGHEWFAFHGERISEILSPTEVFFVPGGPPSLEGVINVRGEIESVIRPHDMLHLSDSGVGQASSILMGRGASMRSGIRVDRIIDVIEVGQSNIQASPSSLPEPMRNYVLGVLRLQERPVAVLDLDTLFADYARGLG